MKKLILISLILLALTGCSASDPLTDDIYVEGTLYLWDGAVWTPASVSTGNITSGAIVADNSIIRGDGGGFGVQDSLATISDLGTLYAPLVTAGNMDSTGKVEADRLIGKVESYSIDNVQTSDLDISLNDTVTLTFLFEPSIIVLDYSARCLHDTTLEAGHSTGHSLITRTGVNTITVNTNMTGLFNNAGAIGTVGVQNDNARAILAYGGNDGVDDSYFYGVATWVSATHVLEITFSTVANTHDAFNYVEILAVAYR